MTPLLIYLIGIAISLYLTVKTFKQMWLNEGEIMKINHYLLAVMLILFSWLTVLSFYMLQLIEYIDEPDEPINEELW
jgi:hypothetical protein